MIRIMNGVVNISRSLGQSWVVGACLFVIAYFAMHAFQGNNGLSALKELDVQRSALEGEAYTLKQRRLTLEARVAKMNNAALDPDLLEELVRKKLGFTHPDEVVVLVD